MVRQDNSARRRYEYEEVDSRRNPYLVEYEEQRRPVRNVQQMTYSGRKTGQRGINGNGRRSIVPITSVEFVPESYEEYKRSASGREREDAYGRETVGHVSVSAGRTGRPSEHPIRRNSEHRSQAALRYGQTTTYRKKASSGTLSANRNVSRRMTPRQAARLRRRRRIMLQRLSICAWALCILVVGSVFLFKNRSSAAGSGRDLPASAEAGDLKQDSRASGVLVQGLPAEKFAGHPAWTEDLLTPNEYSRPGEALEEVNNIFVHYTANPGTSAAQNRSYFEWLKDTHEASVSAHFVIGYEGEIIQCVPLDEIAYAVMTRNYDSISIECCYLEQDGSFTQATYDSLISLLAWLVDAYDLDTEDILRHYDCGGKKCPIYYTNHEDEWEQLKKDVDKL